MFVAWHMPRAKFKYALEQGGDLDAAFFLDCMGELYVLEAEYEHGRLSPEQIKTCRNNLKTKEIIIRLRSKLDALLSVIILHGVNLWKRLSGI